VIKRCAFVCLLLSAAAAQQPATDPLIGDWRAVLNSVIVYDLRPQ
jgi:hypothetical protein